MIWRRILNTICKWAAPFFDWASKFVIIWKSLQPCIFSNRQHPVLLRMQYRLQVDQTQCKLQVLTICLNFPTESHRNDTSLYNIILSESNHHKTKMISQQKWQLVNEYLMITIEENFCLKFVGFYMVCYLYELKKNHIPDYGVQLL